MRVLIVERQSLFRDALAELLRARLAGLEVVAVPSLLDGAPFMARCALGLLILDSGQVGGGQVVTAARRIHPGWKIAVLGDSAVRADLPRGVGPLIDEFLDTSSSGADLLAVISRMVDGMRSPSTAAWPSQTEAGVPAPPPIPAPFAMSARASAHEEPMPGFTPPPVPGARQLTARQQDVLSLLAQGRSTKEIARSLNLGIGTIKAHLDGLYRSLGVHNRTAAVAQAGDLPAARIAMSAQPAGATVIRLELRGGQRPQPSYLPAEERFARSTVA